LRLFITGVAGFAGGHLLEHLAELGGFEAHGADHAPLEAHAHADALRARLASYRALDITSAEAVDSWLASGKPDALIHLAAQASGADALEKPVPTYNVNVMGTLHVLESVRRVAPSARVLVTGSADGFFLEKVSVIEIKTCDSIVVFDIPIESHTIFPFTKSVLPAVLSGLMREAIYVPDWLCAAGRILEPWGYRPPCKPRQ
jgi:nucleoside-diphosphate-sugar epimerase